MSELRELLDRALSEELAQRLEELRASLQRSSVRRTHSGVRVEPDSYQEMDTAVREATMAAEGLGPPRVDHNPFLEPVGGTHGLYSTARNILSLDRRTSELLGKDTNELLAPAGTPPEETFDRQDILQALGKIEDELGDTPLTDVRLKPRLIELLQQQHGGSSRDRPPNAQPNEFAFVVCGFLLELGQ